MYRVPWLSMIHSQIKGWLPLWQWLVPPSGIRSSGEFPPVGCAEFFFSSARCPEVGVSQYITCIPWEITIISMIIACNFPLPAIFDYCASDSLSNLEFLSVKPCERSDFVFAGSSVVHEIPTCHVCKIITTLKHPIMWYLQFKLSCCLYINPVRYG
jgi:hypothetical protein